MPILSAALRPSEVETSRRRELPVRLDDLILVAILNHPRDLEIARVLGWYRIPLATAPKLIHVDWLAFYLPGSFGDDRWSVRYLARVRGHELVIRRELFATELEHPRAEEPYFKMQLGSMLELRPPIPSRSWRRFTFLHTLGSRLITASDLTDLTLPNDRERRRLWRRIAERARVAWSSAPQGLAISPL